MSVELHRLHIWLHQADGDTGYSVTIAELPGCVSQGETKEESLRMIADALSGLLESYHDDGVDVPWVEMEEPKTYGAEWCKMIEEK